MSVDPIKDGVNWYNYCKNNPMAYVDPRGLRPLTGAEISYAKSILGNGLYSFTVDYSSINAGDTSGRGFSLPTGNIGIHEPTMGKRDNKATLMHEIFHQLQYAADAGAFPKLAGEFIANETYKATKGLLGYDAYNVPNLSDIKTLSDIPHLEGQAKFVEQFAEKYDEYQQAEMVATNGVTEEIRNSAKNDMKRLEGELATRADILKRSGVYSDVVNQFSTVTDAEYYSLTENNLNGQTTPVPPPSPNAPESTVTPSAQSTPTPPNSLGSYDSSNPYGGMSPADFYKGMGGYNNS